MQKRDRVQGILRSRETHANPVSQSLRVVRPSIEERRDARVDPPDTISSHGMMTMTIQEKGEYIREPEK
jgi:hypothetical protein